MKKVFLITFSLFFLFNGTADAQRRKERVTQLPNFDKKKLSFAYYLGVNKKGFKIQYNDAIPALKNINLVTVEESYGFNIGLVVDYKLHNNINLRFEPGLSSNTKTLTYNFPGNSPPNTDAARLRKVPGTYLRMPLLLKFSTNRLDNMKAFVIGGASYDFNFSSNQKNSKDNSDGQFRMKQNNFMYELGIGVDLYLPYFKFSPSIRGVFAMNNEIVPDNNGAASVWTGPIDYFGTRGIFINFTFQ